MSITINFRKISWTRGPDRYIDEVREILLTHAMRHGMDMGESKAPDGMQQGSPALQPSLVQQRGGKALAAKRRADLA
jgi:hypothetical protein